jgi:lipopolysaccharide export system protein LptC
VNRPASGIFVAAAAAASLWLHTSVRDQASHPASKQPDFYVKQLRWTLFDQEGQLSWQLQARALEQWPQEEAARLSEPRLHFRDRQQRQWHVEARRGEVYPDSRPLLMAGGVRLQQGTDGSGLTLTTPSLRVDPEGDVVETEATVVLRSGAWHLTSKGMRADLDRQRIALLAQVRGIHE